MARLKDKIVLITGASGAVGKAVAEAVKIAGGTAITSDLAGQGANHALDVTSEMDWLQVIANVGRAYGRLDGLINAAGIAALLSAGVQPVLLPASVYALGARRYPAAREMITQSLKGKLQEFTHR